MNKTISVNLGGRNFFIEEDAYKKLEAYLNGIKAHFAQYQGSAEIVADMEGRIAEKFEAKHQDDPKAVITAKDIDDLIAELGTVEDIAGEEGNKNSGKQSSEGYIPKRLMRNGDDKIIAGVCSGIAAYFDIDPIIPRGIFGVLIFAWGAIIPIYFVLWLIMPEAKTLNDKMQMRGKVFNLDNISETVKERANEFKEHVTNVKTKEEWKKWGEDLKNQAHKVKEDAKDWGKDVEKEMKEKFGPEEKTEKKTEQPQPEPQAPTQSQPEQMKPARNGFGNFLRQIFQGIGKIIVFFVKFIVGIIGFAITISLSIAIAALTISIAVALFNSNSQYVGFPLSAIAHGAPYYFLLFIGYVIALIPLIFLTMLGSSLLSRRNKFNTGAVVSLFSIWVFFLAIGGIFGLRYVPGYIEQIKNNPQMQTVSRNFDAQDFKNLDLSNSGNYRLIQGDTYSIKATGRANDLDRLDVNVNNSTLSISEGGQKFCVFCINGTPTIEITAPEFDSITGHNSVSISADQITATTASLTLTNSSDAKINYITNNLTLNLRNSSDATLAGLGTSTVQTLKAQLSNSSTLNAQNLPANNVEITTANSSTASVNALTTLKYTIFNSSSLYYSGNPALISAGNPFQDPPIKTND